MVIFTEERLHYLIGRFWRYHPVRSVASTRVGNYCNRKPLWFDWRALLNLDDHPFKLSPIVLRGTRARVFMPLAHGFDSHLLDGHLHHTSTPPYIRILP